MNKGKINLLLMVLLCAFFYTHNSNAQMAAAKRIEPKVIKGVSLKASAEEVWKFVSKPENFGSYMSGCDQFKCIGEGQEAVQTYVIPNDKKRKQLSNYILKDDQMISFYVTESEYLDQAWVFRLLVGADEEGSFVQYEGIYSVDSRAKDKELKALLEKEWLLIKKGLEVKFN